MNPGRWSCDQSDHVRISGRGLSLPRTGITILQHAREKAALLNRPPSQKLISEIGPRLISTRETHLGSFIEID